MRMLDRTVLGRIAATYGKCADRMFAEALVCAALGKRPETVACQELGRRGRFIARVSAADETV